MRIGNDYFCDPPNTPYSKGQKISWQDFRDMLLYRRVVAWDENHLTLDNGLVLTVETSDCDCCAEAGGEFVDVVLEAVITDVTLPTYHEWNNEDSYGCHAVVKMLHNQNLVCQVNAGADAGNGGYYYSIASFVVRAVDNSLVRHVPFLASDPWCEIDPECQLQLEDNK